jgi:hypothetical protein
MRFPGPTIVKLALREAVFRVVCRHQQGSRPNILLYCTRRGGSTWLLNTLAAHPGMRYVGRPFLTLLQSRWRRRMPDLARAAGHDGDHQFRHVVLFEGEDERRFESVARDVIDGRLHIYPMLNVRAPYFHRVTDRIVFQMTSGPPLIEWFDARFNVQTVVLFRHPISNALAIERLGWPPECDDFLLHRAFVERHLSTAQYDRAMRISRAGSLLEQHVLDWSLKMLLPYRALCSARHSDWLALSYEQMVSDPERVVHRLSEALDLPDVEAMLAQIRRPSRTVSATTADQTDNPEYLVRRWRRRVDADTERLLLQIPLSLGIDLYQPGHDGPVSEQFPMSPSFPEAVRAP